MTVNIASNIGTSTRWPMPVRSRAINAMTIPVAPRNAPKLDGSVMAE